VDLDFILHPLSVLEYKALVHEALALRPAPTQRYPTDSHPCNLDSRSLFDLAGRCSLPLDMWLRPMQRSGIAWPALPRLGRRQDCLPYGLGRWAFTCEVLGDLGTSRPPGAHLQVLTWRSWHCKCQRHLESENDLRDLGSPPPARLLVWNIYHDNHLPSCYPSALLGPPIYAALLARSLECYSQSFPSCINSLSPLRLLLSGGSRSM
jgi:hypothetical protein